MKQSFICSCILLLTMATGLYSKPAQDHKTKQSGKANKESTQSLDRTLLKRIKCKAVKIEDSKPRSAPLNRNQALTGSYNWSGYAALTNLNKPEIRSVSVVSGAWVVPLLTPTANKSYSSAWVGMDGFTTNSSTVEQIGTESDWVLHPSPHQKNFAWFEIFPGPAFELVGFPVSPGNVMGGEVAYVGDNNFILYIMNFSAGVFTAIPVNVPDAKRNSAEWIIEAPSIGTAIQPLANFTFIPFLECTAKIEGDVGSITDDDWKHEGIVMVSDTDPNNVKAAPTKLKKDGTSFVLGWVSEGP